MIIDEAAWVSDDLLYKAILPMLQAKGSVMVALSSPQGNGNSYSRMLSWRDKTGESFFRIIECHMVCVDCRALPVDKQVDCDHIKPPPWLDANKLGRLKKITAAGMGNATVIQEFAGRVEDDFPSLFDRVMVSETFNLPLVIEAAPPPIIYTAVDPSGGGMSELALCSGYYQPNGETFVVSASRPHMYMERQLEMTDEKNRETFSLLYAICVTMFSMYPSRYIMKFLK